MKLFLCVLAITFCATSGLKLFKTKKEQITTTQLKYDQEKVESQIQELCSTVCSQYSEEYLKLTEEKELANDAEVQKAKARYVTCSLKCTTSIKAEIRSLE
ncbi:Hydrogenosomal chaperonin HSP60 [Trichinella pseudospiralis]